MKNNFLNNYCFKCKYHEVWVNGTIDCSDNLRDHFSYCKKYKRIIDQFEKLNCFDCGLTQLSIFDLIKIEEYVDNF